MSNHHDLTLIRNSLTTRDDIHEASKASNHAVPDQKWDCLQCKPGISASQAGWRLTVSKPLCLSFLRLLRISQSEKTDYYSFKVKVHFKRTCCEGRIFHSIRADHKIGDWLQHSTVQVPAANVEETSWWVWMMALLLNCIFYTTFPNTFSSLDFPSTPLTFIEGDIML